MGWEEGSRSGCGEEAGGKGSGRGRGGAIAAGGSLGRRGCAEPPLRPRTGGMRLRYNWCEKCDVRAQIMWSV